MAGRLTPEKKKGGFRVARQNRIFQDIVEQIQDSILGGEYEPGDVLPSERDLKEMFQTSRGTLREALRVLEQKGLIEIRLGVAGGAVVKASMTEPVAESLALMLRYRQITLPHLYEFREDMEGSVTAMAAQRAETDDIRQLESLLAEAKRMMDGGTEFWKDFLDIDKQFHQALAQIAGNPIYIFLHNIVHENIQSYYDEFLPPDDRRLKENYQDLFQILEAVKNSDADEARRLAENHIRKFSDHMKARIRAAE